MEQKMLQVGERVMKTGFAWKQNEPSVRYGEVAETYNGKPTALDKGTPMLAVKWDDTGLTEYGYLQGGNVVRAPLIVPTVAVTQRVIE